MPDYPSNSVAAVLVAAGMARRLGRTEGKAFLALRGRPIIAYSLHVLHACSAIDRIVVVIRPEDEPQLRELIDRHAWSKCVGHIVHGGSERFFSVRHGLTHLATHPPDLVVIHDAARPLVTSEILQQTIDAAAVHGAAVVGIPAVDTIKISQAEGFVHSTPDRRTLWMVQTPQAFRFNLVWHAYQVAPQETAALYTDDARLVEATGHAVRIVPGSRYNIKITLPEDLLLAEALLSARER